jgi:hypothetical protein
MVPFSLVESARRFGAQRITRRAAADAFFFHVGFQRLMGMETVTKLANNSCLRFCCRVSFLPARVARGKVPS